MREDLDEGRIARREILAFWVCSGIAAVVTGMIGFISCVNRTMVIFGLTVVLAAVLGILFVVCFKVIRGQQGWMKEQGSGGDRDVVLGQEEKSPPTVLPQPAGTPDIAAQAVEQIKESKGIISLNECAKALHCQPNALSKLLTKEVGMSFTDMTNSERMKLAKHMLLTTDLSMVEISEKLKYNNVQNFIRFFKNQEGTTPSVYRKNQKMKIGNK